VSLGGTGGGWLSQNPAIGYTPRLGATMKFFALVVAFGTSQAGCNNPSDLEVYCERVIECREPLRACCELPRYSIFGDGAQVETADGYWQPVETVEDCKALGFDELFPYSTPGVSVSEANVRACAELARDCIEFAECNPKVRYCLAEGKPESQSSWAFPQCDGTPF